MKVLLAIDGSKFSEAATRALSAQAKPRETEVRVLHVIEPVMIRGVEGIGGIEGYFIDWPAITQELRKRGEAALSGTAQALRTAGFQVETALASSVGRG